MPKLRVKDDVYEWSAVTFTNKEGMEIEKVTGKTFDQWRQSVVDGSAVGLTALVYILKRRHNGRIRWEDIEFEYGDIEHVGDEDEPETEDDAEKPLDAVVPGGLNATFDPLDPTQAPEASTEDGLSP